MIERKFVILTLVIGGLMGGGPAEVFAGPGERKPRSFRPIVPIKQNVSGDTETESRTMTVTIPPPPIPDPESSLFPAESVPAMKIPSEPGNGEDEEDAADEPATPGRSGDGEDGDAGDDAKGEVGASPEEEGVFTLASLRKKAHELADLGLSYKFGADDPDQGGMDCSGVIQHMLTELGVEDVPRTSYDQYYWLKRKNLLDDVYGKRASKKLFKKLSPGDLIFWGGTWDSGHRVSHVMLYMGYDPNEDKHYVFGARSRSTEGLLGHGVDIFELDPDRGRLIGHGKIPGIEY